MNEAARSLADAPSSVSFGERLVTFGNHRLLLITIAIISIACGCAIGPRTVQPSSLGYNEVLHDTAETEMLLNLVRARYGEQPVFVEVPSVTQQYDFTGQATIQGHFRNPVFPLGESLAHWILAGTAAERPTIILAPKFDEQFNQRLRAPITIDSMSILVWSGWNIDTVLRVSSNNLNGLDNALMAGRPHPEWPADVADFRQASQLLRQLQLQGKVELVAILSDADKSEEKNAGMQTVSLKNSKKNSRVRLIADESPDKRLEGQPHVIRFAPEVIGAPEYLQLKQLLRLEDTDEAYYPVNAAAEGILKERAPYDKLVLSRRSFSEVIFFLGQGIEVPREHIEAGVAHQTRMGDGSVFDWNHVTGDLICVRSSKKKPKNTEIAVKYRDHWFFIDRSDLASRYTMSLVVELYNMEVRGGGGAAVPLLTIGASGGN